MQHIKKKNTEKQNGENMYKQKILIYPKCALRLTNLKYKVAVDNCSISMNK